jgi:hypothetical protein
MARATLKGMVNEVLLRLREDEVVNVSDTAYSRMIVALVNKVKREVEDSWDWAALRTTYEISTATGVFNYTLNESGVRFRLDTAWNTTDKCELVFMPSSEMDRLFRENRIEGSPRYYSWNGVNDNGDTQVDLYPIPDGPYEIEFQCIVPQPDLSTNDEELLVPGAPVVEGVLAHAITERGEDGGNQSGLQWQVYKGILADYISIESNRFPDEMVWVLR